MSINFNKNDKTKSALHHKIKFDATVGHLYHDNEKYITQRIEDFIATDSASQSNALDEFNQSLRRDIHATTNATKAPKTYAYTRTLPGQVPSDAPTFVPREAKVHPQDIVDFMFQKQDENRATYRQERKEAQDKASNHSLTEYTPPVSLYAPPVQFYDKNRPYFQEYIKYRNELNPVVMPIFTVAKGSIREKAKSSFMPVKDPYKVSKRDQLCEDRHNKVREEKREADQVRTMLRSKKLKETQRLREERQMNILASPIMSSRSSRPSTGFNSHRSPLSGRPGTCNSFSPAALKTAYDRPDYPTAGTIWITDV